jgi:hypothetical protein
MSDERSVLELINRIEALESLSRIDASIRAEFLDHIEALQAALQSAQNTLTAVEILLKNQDRREHEEKVYDAVRACAGIVRVALEKDTGTHE